MSYVNTGVTPGKTEFTDVTSNTAGLNVINIKNKRTSFRIGSASVTSVSGSISLSEPQALTGCEPCDKSVFNSSISCSWNIQAGDGAQLTALKTELDRVYGLMVADYHLSQGLVPPATSTLE